jgi:hypothetical protein
MFSPLDTFLERRDYPLGLVGMGDFSPETTVLDDEQGALVLRQRVKRAIVPLGKARLHLHHVVEEHYQDGILDEVLEALKRKPEKIFVDLLNARDDSLLPCEVDFEVLW